jgi:DNA polymerase-3 subunit alpha
MGSKVELKPSDFVHLHNHTHFSVLDGLQKIKEMVYAAKDMGMEAIAITDHGTLGGAIELYKVCKEAEIRPIIGMEAYVSNRKHTDKDPEIDRQRYHLIILAMNNEGLQNLYRLTSISYIDGFYFKPRIDRDLLKKHNEGLIILSGCIGGELGDALRNGRDKEAEETILWYKEVFGDRYYLELQNHNDWQPQDEVNSKLLELGKKHEIKCVITDDAHYLNKSDQDVHEVLLCVQTASNLDDPKRFSLKDTDLHLSDPKEIIESWGKDHGELILNTKEVASRCNIDLEFGNILIPTFSTQNGETEKTMLHRLTWNGVMARYGGRDWEVFDSNLSLEDEARKELPKELVERIDFELSTVDGMGFNGYFLIVQDFINWGKDNGIIFGPGRGSAAGSVVSYALRITELDPLKYDLLFERFLNPDRISMPDIDIDIQDTRRSEVIEYCVNKYGKERVSNIGTYGVMAAKAAVRDAARVLGMPYIDADRLAKLVPGPVQGRHVPLKKSIEDVEELRQAYNDNEVNKRVLDIAVRLDGTIRNVGVHAAGVIIAPGVLTDYVPLYVAPSGVIASQYTMGPIEDLGLLKMDFLGLSNLTTVNNAVRIVKKV